jgi:hypothetical protein
LNVEALFHSSKMTVVYFSSALLQLLLRQTVNLTTNVSATTFTVLTDKGNGLQAGILHFKTSSSAKLIGKLYDLY